MKLKKVFSLFLALAMLLSCVSCSTLSLTETEEYPPQSDVESYVTEEILETGPITLPEGLSVGYAKKTVNPEEGVGLGGWGTEAGRFSSRVLDNIMITCTALSDGENVFLFLFFDTLYVGTDIVDSVAKRVENKFEGITIPAENILTNATHTHTAPAIHSMNANNIGQYMKKFYPALYFVLEKALRSLSPATMEYASVNTEGLNYVRRYVSLDGTKYLGNWPDPMQPTEGRHETDPDTQLQVVRFNREEGKDVVLCNWQCHPCSSIAGEMATLVSADWCGQMRKYVEENMGVDFAFFQGAAGNLVSSTKIIGEKNNSSYVSKGKELAAVVEKALETATPLQSGTFRALQKKISYNSKSGPGSPMYLSALSIGELAFATVPCEYHDSLGVEVKEASPFKATFFCGYTNGNHGYIPAEYAFKLGGYEVNSTRYVKGTGEAMAKDLIQMLGEIYP